MPPSSRRRSARAPTRSAASCPARRSNIERVADYWGRDLPVNRGLYNFDRIRIEFYQDRQAAFEAFKKGEILFREEFTSRIWANGYDFPAFTAGKVVKREFPGEKRPSMQATAINQRRERFRDPRVRRAIALCFDFEWTNRNLFYGAYERSQSTFEKSDFRAEGLPSPAELALLEPFRGKHSRPRSSARRCCSRYPTAPGATASCSARRPDLLAEAGWTRKDGVLRERQGRTADRSSSWSTTTSSCASIRPGSRTCGRSASTPRSAWSIPRSTRRDRPSFDFDVISMALIVFGHADPRRARRALPLARGRLLPVRRNLPGTDDPAVDALIDAVGAAKDRASADRCHACARPGLARAA